MSRDSRYMCLGNVMHKERANEPENASVNGAKRSASKGPLSFSVMREHRVRVLL
jgi:hypothetical protein